MQLLIRSSLRTQGARQKPEKGPVYRFATSRLGIWGSCKIHNLKVTQKHSFFGFIQLFDSTQAQGPTGLSKAKKWFRFQVR